MSTCKPRPISGNLPFDAIKKYIGSYCGRIVGDTGSIIGRFIINLLTADSARTDSTTVMGYESDAISTDSQVLLDVPSETVAIQGGRLATSVDTGATLGDELFTYDLTTGIGLTVDNEDLTHIVIFGVDGMRYQSDTQNPILSVTTAPILTIGDTYQITAALTTISGDIKISSIGDTVLIDGVSIEGVATDTTVTIFRNTVDVDVTLHSLSIKKVIPAWKSTFGNIPLSCWGDSLTFRKYPYILNNLMPVNNVYNFGKDSDTSTQIKTRFDASADKYKKAIIVWAGTNNPLDAATVKSDIASMVSQATNDNYIVLSLLNSDVISGWSGGLYYDAIIALNNDLSTLYGNRYLDVRTMLVNSYNPGIPQDVIDFNHDVSPSSLRSDTLHLNTDGCKLVAGWVSDKINSVFVDLVDGSQLTTALQNSGAGTQYLVNPTTPATQTTGSLAPGMYTIYIGDGDTGSVLVSSGTATITGAAAVTDGIPNTIEVTVAGTVTATVTGTLSLFQLNGGTIPLPFHDGGASPLAFQGDVTTYPMPTNLTGQRGAIELVVTDAGADINGKFLLYSGDSAANAFDLNTTDTLIIFRKALVGPLLSYTITGGVPFKVQLYWDNILGMGIRASNADSDISVIAFETVENFNDMPINGSMSIGNRLGVNQFQGLFSNTPNPITTWSSAEEAGFL